MLPRKRANKGAVVAGDTDPMNSTNSGAVSFLKKARIGSLAACSGAGAAESAVSVSGQGFGSGSGDGDNSVGNLVGGMALGNSQPVEIMWRLFGSSVLVSRMQGLGVEIGNQSSLVLDTECTKTMIPEEVFSIVGRDPLVEVSTLVQAMSWLSLNFSSFSIISPFLTGAKAADKTLNWPDIQWPLYCH